MGEIAANPELHAEARAVAPLLQRIAAPCGQEAVRLALQPLALVFPPGARAETPAFWEVYFKALCDLPAEALAKAVEEYPGLPTAEHFPKPGPLKALAERHAQPIRQAAYRAKRAADSLPRRPIDKGEAETRKAMIAETLATLGAKTP